MNATSHLLSAYKRFWILLKDLARWIWQCQVNLMKRRPLRKGLYQPKWLSDFMTLFDFLVNYNVWKEKGKKPHLLLSFHSNMYRIVAKVWFYCMLLLSGMNRSVWHNEFCFTFSWADSSWQYRQWSVWPADEGGLALCCHRSFIDLLYLMEECSEEGCSLYLHFVTVFYEKYIIICKAWKPIYFP